MHRFQDVRIVPVESLQFQDALEKVVLRSSSSVHFPVSAGRTELSLVKRKK